MELSHVLVHTSVKEGTPHVVLEALSMGLPVVCHDACGMGTAVTEDSGIKINLIDPATSEREIRNAIHRLLNEAALLTRISAGATKRADELKWDNNLEIFMTAYRLEDQNKEHSFALDNPR
jgi:glycosyltransferase involved in cell wall biosynthesis